MPDSTTSSIDRVFDLVDKVVDGADRVLNRSKHTEEQHRVRRARRAEIDTAPSVKTGPGRGGSGQARATRPTTVALVRRPQWRIVEATDASTGAPVFVVTDGGNARAECNTREMAERLLGALEKTP